MAGRVEYQYSARERRYLYNKDVFAQLPDWYTTWLRQKPQWLTELAGEFFGVFCYVYLGIGSQAALFLSSATKQPAFGSLFTVGAAYAVGIAFAIIVGGSSSEAHFNPAFTLAQAVWRGFSWRKVPGYMFAQFLGGFVAAFVVYCQYRPYLMEVEAGMRAAGEAAAIFSSNGPAGIFAFYPNAGIGLRWVFANEFFVDMLIGLVFWAIIDYSNYFSSPASVPASVGVLFGVCIWCFGMPTAVLNPARDFGPRLVTIAIWGRKAWGGKYAALSVFTPFLGTFIGTSIYQLLLTDPTRVVTSAAREYVDLRKEHKAFRKAYLGSGGSMPMSVESSFTNERKETV